MEALLRPEEMPTQSTWVDRARGRERRRVDPMRIRAPSEQSGIPPDVLAYMPRAAGAVPLAPEVAQLARVLRTREHQRRALEARAAGGPAIETDAAPGTPTRVSGPVQATMRQSATNSRATFTGETTLLSSSRQRTWLLVINIGADDVWLAFDKSATSEDGIPLRTPDGYIELTHGCTSEVRAFAAAGTTGAVIVAEALAYPALERA